MDCNSIDWLSDCTIVVNVVGDVTLVLRTSITKCVMWKLLSRLQLQTNKQIPTRFKAPESLPVVLNLSVLFCLYGGFRDSLSVNESIRKHAKNLKLPMQPTFILNLQSSNGQQFDQMSPTLKIVPWQRQQGPGGIWALEEFRLFASRLRQAVHSLEFV